MAEKKRQPRAIRIEVTRTYFRGGRVFKPGAVIVVPEYAVKGITEASPPFGKVVGDAADTSEGKK